MHQTRKLLAQVTEPDRQERHDTFWTVAAVTLISVLMVAVAVALYPSFS